MPNYYIKCDDCSIAIRECTKQEKSRTRYDGERCVKCQEKHDREELFQSMRHEDQMERMRTFVRGLKYCLEREHHLGISDSDIEFVLDAFTALRDS